jgi:hypothetical protein
MRGDGFLSQRLRRGAWLIFGSLAVHAPVAAHLLPDASWLASAVVAAMVGVVIIADDAERQPRLRRQTDES